MTRDARRALIRAGLSRREFMTGAGALIVTFGAAGANGRLQAQGPFDTRIQQVDPRRLDAWVAVGADGRVTAYTGKCELGQGMQTAQMQLVAEELSVPIDRVTLVQCDTSVAPDQGTTSGSQSTPGNFNQQNLGLAAATAREALVAMAAQRLGIAAAQLAANDGAVVARTDPARRATYGELIGGRRFERALDGSARRKSPADWKVLGTSAPRVDMTAMVTGQLEYVHQVAVAGMLHGRVVRPSSVGATLAGVDAQSVRGLPGVVQVVVRKNFVGVVAEREWQAVQAAAALKVNWTPGAPLPPQADFYTRLRRQPSRDAFLVDSGTVNDSLARAATVLRSTYLHPYQMHGSIGTSCAVADVRDGHATVWSATQSAYPLRSGVAMLLGLPAERVPNPDGVRQQLEGGALQGMSRALEEEVTWDERSVTSIDWRTYRSLPLGFRIPAMECVLIDRTDGPAMGAGETSITLSAAAIGNAIFDATGVRIREVPFTRERIKRALEERR